MDVVGYVAVVVVDAGVTVGVGVCGYVVHARCCCCHGDLLCHLSTSNCIIVVDVVVSCCIAADYDISVSVVYTDVDADVYIGVAVPFVAMCVFVGIVIVLSVLCVLFMLSRVLVLL